MISRVFILCFLAGISTAFAQPQLIKDIGSTPKGLPSTTVLVKSGNKVFFVTHDKDTAELWRSDGTPQGTFRLQPNFYPDVYSTPAADAFMTDMNGVLMFSGYTPTDSQFAHLFTTNGDADEPTAYKTMSFPGIGRVFVQATIGLNGKAFLIITDNASREMYLLSTDGTDAGTVIVKHLEYDNVGDKFGGVTPKFVKTDNRVYALIPATNNSGGNSYNILWSSDGTEAGTIKVARKAANLQGVGSTLYFTITNELWKTDGSLQGTVKVADQAYPIVTGSFDEKLVYSKLGFYPAFETWISDGTSAGTLKLGDRGINDSYATLNSKFYAVGQATNSSNELVLFSSDGTSAGTQDLFSLGQLKRSGMKTIPVINNKLIIPINTPETGVELAICDGVNAPEVLKDINPGAASSINISASALDFLSMILLDDKLYFMADDGVHGMELWVTDGTSAGTHLVNEARVGTVDATGEAFKVFSLNGNPILTAISSSHIGYNPSDIYKATNNPLDATKILSGVQSVIGVANNDFYYVDKDYNLRVTDGTDDGIILKTIGNPQYYPTTNPGEVVSIGDKVIFRMGTVNPGFVFGSEFWVTDGTAANTKILKDINPGSGNGVSPGTYNPFVKINESTILFGGNDGVHGVELWKTDGTPEGTTMVSEIRAGAAGSDLVDFIELNGIAYFRAHDGDGTGLWRSDGTQAGTYRVVTIDPSANSYFVSRLYAANNNIYFDHGDLFKSDGSVGNASPVRGSSFDDYPNEITESGGKIFFSAGTDEQGRELWVSDGTIDGTYQIDIIPGATGSNPKNFVAIDGGVYFNANNELWRSNGTAAKTEKVADLDAGVISNLDGVLYFNAYTEAYGREYYKLVPEPFCTIAKPSISMLPGVNDPKPRLTSTSMSNNSWYFGGIKIDGATASTIEIQKAGSYTVQVAEDGCESDMSDEFIVDVQDQTISFTLADQKFEVGTFDLEASTSSGMRPTYSANSDIVSISQSKVTIKAAGKVTITAEAGDDLYQHVSAQQTICILPAKPVITMSSVDPSKLQLTSSSDNYNNWYFNGALITGATESKIDIQDIGVYTVLVVTESCASEISDGFVVTKQDQTIEFNPGDHDILESTFKLDAVASSGLTVTFTTTNPDKLRISGTTATLLAPGKATIEATQAGDDFFNSASKQQTICIIPERVWMLNLMPGQALSTTVGLTWYKNGVALDGDPTEDGDYTVTTTVDGCVSPISDVIHVVINGLEDEIAGMSIYPNPVKETIYINSNSSGHVEIMTPAGQKLHQQTFTGNVAIPFSASPGIYILKISTDNKVVTRKLIKE